MIPYIIWSIPIEYLNDDDDSASELIYWHRFRIFSFHSEPSVHSLYHWSSQQHKVSIFSFRSFIVFVRFVQCNNNNSGQHSHANTLHWGEIMRKNHIRAKTETHRHTHIRIHICELNKTHDTLIWWYSTGCNLLIKINKTTWPRSSAAVLFLLLLLFGFLSAPSYSFIGISGFASFSASLTVSFCFNRYQCLFVCLFIFFLSLFLLVVT